MSAAELERPIPAYTLESLGGDRTMGTAFQTSTVVNNSQHRPDWATLKKRSSGRPKGVWCIVEGDAFCVTGRYQETLLALFGRGDEGVTALDFPGGPAWRLAGYVHQLRKDCGLIIETHRETHVRGWHARYVLRTAVRPIQSEAGFND